MSEPIKIPLLPGQAIVFDHIVGKVYVAPPPPSLPGTAA